jgi:hypothetical protein
MEAAVTIPITLSNRHDEPDANAHDSRTINLVQETSQHGHKHPKVKVLETRLVVTSELNPRQQLLRRLWLARSSICCHVSVHSSIVLEIN